MSRKQTPISSQYQLSGQVLEEVKVYRNSSNSTRTELTFQLIGKLEYAEKRECLYALLHYQVKPGVTQHV